ncbi:hypothetical protein PIB30_061795 [Stylosanthes scabra]|uniref:Glycosyltransferase family 92 protein n=1 Tax=Stylosanthes scabra TaxID=79078 RepID=A0ABU6TLN7_9FABA|nr:hypothetical protein [Stylosanthes scabra]
MKLLFLLVTLLCLGAPLLLFLQFYPSLSFTTTPSDQLFESITIKRIFNPYGSATYNFITMGAYREGLNTFSIIGLASKALHDFSNPTYECNWISSSSSFRKPISTVGYKILADVGFGRVYSAIVLNCTFSKPVNADNNGGKLVLRASTNGGGDAKFNLTDTIDVLDEYPNAVNFSTFTSSPKYDYFYCGSPIYGNLNPQRIREWIAYHVKFLGPNSHFAIYDAGGVHEKVLEVLKPWMELGYITLHDIRDQERFDGYYHNQFIVINDCLHRYKFMAKWIFYFDVDEYVYIPGNKTLNSVMDSLSHYSQFTFDQMPMSSNICSSHDYGKTYGKWGFEKLVYKNSNRGIRWDRKSAAQPRSLYAAGVHWALYLAGETLHQTNGTIVYYHYHGTIADNTESCKMYVNSTQLLYEKTPYVLDTTMRDIAADIKKFELQMIGSRLEKIQHSTLISPII